ncbi:hypothetical protein [Steroidobacter sp.]|uniref:hypothetical protein n=1 Tax=Steroidobacter sp. TaxID=1978227 RepID=UPI001A511633|nr:hypothetical protein [Steroidobacter sp.]MBL8271256.1 hypothetical protein [Steroidobacter sp.]
MTAKYLSWVALLSLSASGAALAQAPIAPEPITAVYKATEISFNYRNSSRHHTCQELQQRVALILLAVGARDDLKVQVRNCDVYMMPEEPMNDPVFGRDNSPAWNRDRNRDPWNDPTGGFRSNTRDQRSQTAMVRVQLLMPVEVTPQVMQEIDKDKSRRELISRVTKNPVAAMNDPIVFAAVRQEVTLSSKTLKLRPEDCYLLEEMTPQVFRKLNVKVVDRTFNCGPRDSSRIAPQLTVEALLPTGAIMPMPDPEKQKRAGATTSPEPTEPPAPTPEIAQE